MQVYLDGNLVEGTHGTLAQALDAAMRAAGDRLIIEAVADGAPVPHDHLEQPPDTSPYAQELQLTSADPAALVRMTLYSAADTIDEIRPKQESSAELLQTGRTEQAMHILGEVLDSWETVRRSVELLREVQTAELLQVDESVADLVGAMGRLAELLAEIRDALRHQDLTSVADIIAYDLNDHAEVWRTRLVSAAEAIGGAAP